MYWCVLLCLGAFWMVSLLHETRCKMGWTGSINAKVRATKSHWNFLQRTHPIHSIWTLNSCFGSICSIWVHFGLFRYCTKLDTKWAEQVQLMQKFVPRSRIRTFTTNAPDPPHCTLNSCFGASHSIWVHLAMFRYYTKLGAKRVELVQLMQKFGPWSRIRIFRNERIQSTPLGSKVMFWCFS